MDQFFKIAKLLISCVFIHLCLMVALCLMLLYSSHSQRPNNTEVDYIYFITSETERAECMKHGEAGVAVFNKIFEDHGVYLLSSLMVERDCTTIKLKMRELGHGEGDSDEQKEVKLRDIQKKLKGILLVYQ